MAGIQIGQLPAVTSVDSQDLLPVAQGVTTPGTGATRKATAAELSESIAAAVNVKAFGAVGDGTTDDTAAIIACFASVASAGGTILIPEGTYKFAAPLPLYSNTTLLLRGTLKAAPIGQWPGTPYFGLTNFNRNAAVLTDENITIIGGTIDYTDLPAADGTRHIIFLRMVTGVRIENVNIYGGSSAVALLGCYNTLELGNRYLNFLNCGSDHWEGTSNCRVIGCHIESGNGFAVAQMVNFNPDPTVGPSAGYMADGFVLQGCTIISYEVSTTPIQIEPLGAGAFVRNVTVSGNVFRNVRIACRADTSGMSLSDNVFSDFSGPSEAITAYDRHGVPPGDIVVQGNIIRDPLTSVSNVAVVRIEATAPQILNNVVTGTGYLAVPFYTGNPPAGQIFGNVTNGLANTVPGRLQTGMILAGGSANYYGWTDASGSVPRIYLQTSDNNFIVQGTDSVGAARPLASIYQRSDSSEWIWSVSNRFLGATRYRPTLVDAAGTNIGTATLLDAANNYIKVITCTTGVADGVALSPEIGKPQTITNATADPLNVYPNNSGAGTINGGAIGAPVVIAAGKSATFFQHETNSFWIVSEYA